jgi:hypothetical protein
MAIEAICPKGHKVELNESQAGSSVTCPVCGEPFVASKAAEAARPAAPPSLPAGRFDWRNWQHRLAAADFVEVSTKAGRPMLIVGFILVLLARGCDGLARRSVDRATARVSVAQAQFDDTLDKQRLDLERKKAALEEKEEPTAEDTQRIQDLRNQLRDQEKLRQKALHAFEVGKLRDLKIAARDAEANFLMGGYWRELFFVFGAIVLSIGLLLVSAIARGAELWVTLLILAIITFSLFVYGTAWVPIGK